MHWETMTRKPDSRPDDGADLAALDAALAALRRSQSRRALARLSERRLARAGGASLPDAVFELIDAVAAAPDPLTVTEAAGSLGVDQPRASRLAAQAIDAGMLRRVADQADGRRSILVATARGRRALEHIGDFRRQVIAEATADWPDDDRAALARLLTRFVEDFGDVTDPRD